MKIPSLAYAPFQSLILIIPACLALLSGCCGGPLVQHCGPYGACTPMVTEFCVDACGHGPGLDGNYCYKPICFGIFCNSCPVRTPVSMLLTRATYNDHNYMLAAHRQAWCADSCVPVCAAPPACAVPTCAIPPVCAAPLCAAPVCAVPDVCVTPPVCAAPVTCAVPPSCAIAATCVIPPVCVETVSCAVPTCVAPSDCAPSCEAPVACVAPSCAVPPGCAVPVNCVVTSGLSPILALLTAPLAAPLATPHLALAPPQLTAQSGTISSRKMAARSNWYARTQNQHYHTPMMHTATPQMLASHTQPAPAVKSMAASKTDKKPVAKFPSPGLETKSDREIETLVSRGMEQQADGSWVPAGMNRPQIQQVNHEEIPAYTPREDKASLLVPEPAAESSKPQVKSITRGPHAKRSYSYKRAVRSAESDLPQAPPVL